MKLWKKIAFGAAGLIALLVAFDLGGRLLFPDKWAELDEQVDTEREGSAERKRLADKQKADEKKPSAAMYAGGLVAMDLANNGAVRPASDKVEALARKAATESGVADPLERRKYVDDWQRGFWAGWKSATR